MSKVMLETCSYQVNSVLGTIVLYEFLTGETWRLSEDQTTRFKREWRNIDIKAGEDRDWGLMINRLCADMIREIKIKRSQHIKHLRSKAVQLNLPLTKSYVRLTKFKI